ncbi:MAG: VWA domain-containing protein [Phycisphaerae bacterium]|nr:VWA domain-containing protein [Phycisphaerae bacterium]
MAETMPSVTSAERIEEQLELARWSSGNALLIGVAATAVLLYVAWWMYRHERRGDLRWSTRTALVSCRWLVLILLGLIGLEPVLARYVHRRLDATTIVLVDASASMQIIDRYRDASDARRVAQFVGEETVPSDRTRWALARELLSSEWLAGLASRNRVEVFTFADRTERISMSPTPVSSATGPAAGAPALPAEAMGRSTNWASAVQSAIDSLGGAPVAGVVVVSDGAFNAGEPPEAAMRYLKARQVPVYAVGVGDPSPPLNVRVVDVTAPRTVFKGEPFQVTAFLSAEGVSDRTLTVDLLERRANEPGPSEPRATQSVRVRGDGGIDPVVFERRLERAGEASFVVRVRPMEDESIAADNARETLPAVRALDDQMRVLLVGGGPSYDYRFLARLLIRDKTVDVSCWLQSADDRAVREGDTVIDHLPSTPKELFEFDAVLLFDVDPREIDGRWASLAASLVTDYGGGLLYSAGRQHTTEFMRSTKIAPLVELLPVTVDTNAELVLNDLGLYQRKPWPIVVPDDALTNPIVRLSDDVLTNRAIWGRLEGIYWHYPVRREKPAATVLMRHANPRMVNADGAHVLLATQFVGSGRTAFIATNDTWRWRRSGETYFNRFWVQMLRFLVEGKLLGARNRGLILTDKDRFVVGESVIVTARLLDEKFGPLRQASVDATATFANGETRTVTLEPVPNRAGYYQGRFITGRAGTVRLSVTLPGRGGPALRAERDVVVSQPDVEMTQPMMRREALRELAEQTGGRYFEIDEARALPAAIEHRGQTQVLRERPRPLWDNGWVLGLLLTVLSVEWILRRAATLL